MPRTLAVLAVGVLAACNPDPRDQMEQSVEYRDGVEEDYESGERGTVKISEIFWSGSVTDDGVWDPDDVFIELRNEGNKPLSISGWRLEMEGAIEETWRIPDVDWQLPVGEHVFIAAKDTGCFLQPDILIPDLQLTGDAFYLSLRDKDEHIMDSAGDRGRAKPAYCGGYDLVTSRSMERIEMMFGPYGSAPHAWHHYTTAEVDVPNNDRIAEGCRQHTHASPGRPSSPDYSGAFSSGSLE